MLEIRVIGNLEVRLAGQTAELPASRRARSLLGWLAIHPGRHSRSRLAGQFWPDVLEASARASLRSAIWALRSVLGPEFGGYLAAGRDTVTLSGDDLCVDLREVQRLIGQDQPEAALAFCRGDLLQELDDDWVVEARADLDRDIAAALGRLTQQARAAGDTDAALAWARRRAALCPLDESAGADLIRTLMDAGQAPAALEALAALRHRLGSELGITVSAATAAIVGPLRRPGSLSAAAGPVDPAAPAARADPAAPAADSARDAGGSSPRGSPGLIGRDRPFAQLTSFWSAVCASAGTVVALDGEGGIGKTRLVEELRAAVHRASPGVTAVSATAAAGPGPAAPFAIWADALGDLASLAGLPPGDQAWAADLARIVPALGYLAGVRPGARPAADPRLERVQLCEAVVQFLAWAGARAPLLLAFEDLHLADTPSLELIAYVGRRLSRLPVLLILTRRRLPGRQDLDAVLGALRARGALAAEIHVERLTDDEARALIRSTAELPRATVEQIVQLAAGSPLLAVEAARAARTQAVDPTTGDPTTGDPTTGELVAGLAGAVRLATSGLSAQARVFVEFAAAAGRALDRSEVAALPLPNPARAAAEALGSGLLTTDDGRTGFRHALLRDAAYHQIPDPIRARLHGELAQLLRKRPRPPGQRDRTARPGPRAAEIARHLRLAGHDDQAVGYLVRAARDARGVAAMAEAADFLTEALQIEPDDPDLLVELAEVEAFRGLTARSDHAFDQALEQIAPQDSGALISAWLRRGRWLRGGVCHPRESRRSYQSALDVLDRDPGYDLGARAEALAGLAWAEAVAGDPAAVDKLLADTDAILGGDHPGDLLAHDIGVARGHALIRAGQFAASFGPLIAASAAAGRAGRPDMAYSCLSNAASAAACAGEFGRALDFTDRCLPLVVPNGLLRLAVYAYTARCAILRRLGRLPEAREACDAAAGCADRVGLPELDGLVHQERGLLALAADDPAAASAALTSALDLDAPVSRAATRLRLAEALVLAGQPDRAEAALREVVLEPVSPSDFPATLVARMSRIQGLIASVRGDTALAERRLAESLAAWQRIARTLDSRQTGAGYVASLIDLGRPPVSSLVEPARELAEVEAELSALRDHPVALRQE
jgi:DNA-binding SARP family transcriptional activator/tetratricopeptide (TPR) repeat protein